MIVGLDAFVHLTPAAQSNTIHLYHTKDYDFSLIAGCSAIHRGSELPTITDCFTGSAPDLGVPIRGRCSRAVPSRLLSYSRGSV